MSKPQGLWALAEAWLNQAKSIREEALIQYTAFRNGPFLANPDPANVKAAESAICEEAARARVYEACARDLLDLLRELNK